MSLDTRSFEQKMYRAGSNRYRRPPQGADPHLPRPAKALVVFESPLVYCAGGKHWPVSSSTVPQAPENVFPGNRPGVPVDRVAPQKGNRPVSRAPERNPSIFMHEASRPHAASTVPQDPEKVRPGHRQGVPVDCVAPQQGNRPISRAQQNTRNPSIFMDEHRP